MKSCMLTLLAKEPPVAQGLENPNLNQSFPPLLFIGHSFINLFLFYFYFSQYNNSFKFHLQKLNRGTICHPGRLFIKVLCFIRAGSHYPFTYDFLTEKPHLSYTYHLKLLKDLLKMKQERTGVSQAPRPHKWPGEAGNKVFFPEETKNRFEESTCFLPLVPACA